MAHWIKISYERDKQVYVIDLDRISAFSLSWNGRLTLYLSNHQTGIEITQQSDPEAYHKILDYIKETTGFPLP
ncbi:hypothetical protein [Kamptonema formosum]|uniref:hypothetical protein n=1 Tax=Kamptonema formosum TaxID=331992 RepID=UPI0003469997|nr:hypothetical protein [Oscillatoria sp. PCC 10802]